MATKKVTLTYKGSVKPKKTTFLASGDITMDFETEIELEDSDIANAKAVQQQFQALLDKQLKQQLSHLDTWLTEKDTKIKAMVDAYEKFGKAFPTTESDAKKRQAALEQQKSIAAEIDKLPEVWTGIVNDWANNARQQQGLIAAQMAVKAARIKTFNDKRVRVGLGQAIKVVLVVAAIAIGIAATVLSAGTTAPVFVALAATGLALSGIGSLAQTGKSLKENFDVEKKILSSVEADVKSITAVFNASATAGSKIAKHVTELQNLIRKRVDSIKSLAEDVKRYEVMAASYAKDLATLRAAKAADASAIDSRTKSLQKVDAGLKATKEKMVKLIADNQAAQILLKSLSDLQVDLQKLSTQAPNTIAGNLKARFTSIDGLSDLAQVTGGLVGGVSGLHS